MKAANHQPRPAQPRPKRIAVFWPSLVGGGAERSALFVAETLAQAGYAVDCVVSDARGELADDPFLQAHLVPLGNADPLLTLPAWLRYLKRSRPDLVISLVHSANFVSGIGARLFPDIPVVLSIRNTLVKRREDQWWLRRRFGFGIEKWLYRKVARVQTVSEAIADQAHLLWRVPRAKLVNTWNSAQLPDGAPPPATPAERAAIAAAAPYLVSVGRLVPIKGFDVILRAFARARLPADWTLLIVGEGPDRARLEALAEEKGVAGRVRLIGWRDPVLPWIAGARGFLFATFGEGFPRVVHEALLANVPIAVGDCPGMDEVVGGGRFGRLVPMGDVEGFARAMEDMAAGVLTRPDPVALGRHLDLFTPQAVGARYIAMVEELIGPARPAPHAARGNGTAG